MARAGLPLSALSGRPPAAGAPLLLAEGGCPAVEGASSTGPPDVEMVLARMQAKIDTIWKELQDQTVARAKEDESLNTIGVLTNKMIAAVGKQKNVNNNI